MNFLLNKYRTQIFTYGKNSIFYFGGSIVQLIISIFTTPLFAEYLSSDDFAAFGFFDSVVQFFTPFMTLSFYTYYMKVYYKKSEDEKKELLPQLVGFLLFWNILILLLGMVIIKIYFVLVGVTFSFYPLALYTLLSGSLQVFVNFALLNYKMKQTGDKYFYLSMSSSILRIGLGLFFVIYMLKGIEGRFLGQLLGFIVVAVISIVSLVGYNSEKLKKLFTFNLDFKSIIRFSLPLVFLGYLDYPLIYLDKILLERLGNNVQFALYNLGSSFSGFLFAFGSAIFQSVEPDLYKHASNENYHSFAKIMILILILVIIVNLVFMFFSPYLTGYLTRYKYTDSYKYANILCWNNLVLLLSYGLGIILITKEKTMLSLKIKIFVSILAIIILYLFIVKFDFYGAAYAKILVNVIYVITMVFIIFREVNKRPNLKTETLTVK